MLRSFSFIATLLLTGCSHDLSLAHQDAPSAPKVALETASKIPELMDAFGVTGLAVTAVSGDKILLQEGFGETLDGKPFTASTRCGLFSATKVFASLAYTRLNDQKALNLDAPLGTYIEDAPSDWKDIPFFRLLNHSSGITMVVNKPEFGTLASDVNSTNASIYELLRNEPLDHAPGASSRYRQSGYAIGEMILHDRLGLDFATLVENTITGPTGMSSTSHPAADSIKQAPILLSAGGYETTAADMAKLFLALNKGTIIKPTSWKNTLLRDGYLFVDYSLGSVIERSSEILTVGHSGGGARANVRYAPDSAIGAMVCTDDVSNNGLAMPLARMLIQEIASGETPPLPMLVVAPNYSEMAADQVIDAVQEAEKQVDRYDLDGIEVFINEVGYTYLAQDQLSDAVKVFTFNAERFPNSPNAHDSLGEALFAKEEFEAALVQYQNVLRLDPDNEHAEKMVREIIARRDEHGS